MTARRPSVAKIEAEGQRLRRGEGEGPREEEPTSAPKCGEASPPVAAMLARTATTPITPKLPCTQSARIGRS